MKFFFLLFITFSIMPSLQAQLPEYFVQVTNGIGLDNIRKHVLAYNGKMTIHSSLGKGTEISIEIENLKKV